MLVTDDLSVFVEGYCLADESLHGDTRGLGHTSSRMKAGREKEWTLR